MIEMQESGGVEAGLKAARLCPQVRYMSKKDYIGEVYVLTHVSHYALP
jgi:hypothetical protein